MKELCISIILQMLFQVFCYSRFAECFVADVALTAHGYLSHFENKSLSFLSHSIQPANSSEAGFVEEVRRGGVLDVKQEEQNKGNNGDRVKSIRK